MQSTWNKLNEIFSLRESDPDDFSDDELDALTSPTKSFSNPFEPNARTSAKVNTPPTKMTQKPRSGAMAPPAPKDDFGNALNPNSVRKIDPSRPAGNSPGLAKPNYDGKFVGQVFSSAGKTAPVRSMWKDKMSGDMRFGGRRETQTKVDLVWDGADWITPAVFDMKAKSGQLSKKEGLEEMFMSESFGPLPPETPRGSKDRTQVPVVYGMKWWYDKGSEADERTITSIANVLGIHSREHAAFLAAWRNGEKKQKQLAGV